MQFQVPQFIEVEDKIVGPLSFKQFAYAGSGVGVVYLAFRFIPWAPIALVVSAAIGGFFFALAFYKYNNRPFITLVDAGMGYFSQTRLYVWKRKPREDLLTSEVSIENIHSMASDPQATPANIHSSKLGDLSWQIDVKGNDISEQKVTH